jgi:hypothetical protein
MPKLRTIAVVALTAALVGSATAPASAGFFDRLFGGITRHIRPPAELPNLPQMSPIPGDRIAPQGGENWRPRGDGGPRTAFCVRTCDGHYFPVNAQPGFSAAQACSSFCPAAETRLYTGSGIDGAVGVDGRAYSELPAAYAYRKKVVAGCTCNGKDTFGVARLDINSDPTLQRGDVVVTRDGMKVVSAQTENGAQLTAAKDYRGLPARSRQTLSDLDVATARKPVPQTEGRPPSDR